MRETKIFDPSAKTLIRVRDLATFDIEWEASGFTTILAATKEEAEELAFDAIDCLQEVESGAGGPVVAFESDAQGVKVVNAL